VDADGDEADGDANGAVDAAGPVVPSVVMAFSDGKVRRNPLSVFLTRRRASVIATKPQEGVTLVDALLVADGASCDVLLVASSGKGIRFPAQSLRISGSKIGIGVAGMKLENGEQIVSAAILSDGGFSMAERTAYLKARKVDADDEEAATAEAVTLAPETLAAMEANDQTLLVMTAKGFGKRMPGFALRQATNRGGKGMSLMRLTGKTGSILCCMAVEADDEVILADDGGQVIRVSVNGIGVRGRVAGGVRVFDVDQDRLLVSASRIPVQDDVS
jgi:DNA gyrase subunit A